MMTRYKIVVAFILASFVVFGYAVWSTGIWRQAVKIAEDIRPSANADTLTFVVVGDNHGANPIYRQMVEEIRGGKHAFLLNVADLTETGTSEEFAELTQLHKLLPFPIEYTVGNHDIRTDHNRQLFVDAFGQQPCRAVDYQQLHLIVLDNADRKVGFPDDCLDWLEADLAGNSLKPTVIAYHRPFGLPLSSLTGDDDTPAARLTNERFKTIIAPYKNIQLILSGHIHTYIPYTLAGIPAVVSGGGGDPAQSAIGGAKANFFHYLVVTAKNETLSYAVKRLQISETTTEEQSDPQ